MSAAEQAAATLAAADALAGKLAKERVEALIVIERVMPDRIEDALQLFDHGGLAKLALFAAPLEAYVEKAKALGRVAPTTDEEEAVVVQVLSDGVLAVKELEALRRKTLDGTPENPGPGARVKAINEMFHLLTDPIEAHTQKRGPLEKVILAWRDAKAARIRREEEEARRKQEEAARKEREALEAAERARTAKGREAALAKAEAASLEQAQAAVQVPLPMNKGTRTESGSVTANEKWTFTIEQADLVPAQYLVPDEKKIRAAVESGVRAIPGCNIFPQAGLVRRAGR